MLPICYCCFQPCYLLYLLYFLLYRFVVTIIKQKFIFFFFQTKIKNSKHNQLISISFLYFTYICIASVQKRSLKEEKMCSTIVWNRFVYPLTEVIYTWVDTYMSANGRTVANNSVITNIYTKQTQFKQKIQTYNLRIKVRKSN